MLIHGDRAGKRDGLVVILRDEVVEIKMDEGNARCSLVS
jgi:hypothetical protein